MAIWPFGYTESTNVDEDNDFSGGGGLLRTPLRQRRWKFKTIREYLQDSLIFLNGLKLNASRVAMQDFDAQPILQATIGWMTIAQSETNSSESMSAEFSLEWGGNALTGGMKFNCLLNNGTVAKNRLNNHIEILGRSTSQISKDLTTFSGVRIVKSDSVASAGFKVQILKTNLSSVVKMSIIISQNTSFDPEFKGLIIVEPTLTDNDKTPNGNVGTFLEAGEEYEFVTTAEYTPAEFVCYKLSDDIAVCSLIFEEIPKIGTTIALTLPSSFLKFVGLNGVTTAGLSATYTISNETFLAKQVSFRINKVGFFSGLSIFQPAFPIIAGDGMKITIS